MRLVCLSLWVIALAGCASQPAPPGPPVTARGQDASAYDPCPGLCRRPSDCALAYSDDGLCPPGFRCALRVPCADAGTSPDGG